MPPFDLKQAASNMIDAGASDDEIKGVLGSVKQYAGQLIDQGKSDDEIANLIGKTKWKNTEIFKTAPQTPTATQSQHEQPGLMSNLGTEFKGGVRQLLHPSEAEFPWSAKLRQQGMVGETVANVIGGGLGAAQAALSFPSALSKTYLEQPLQGTPIDRDVKIPFPTVDPEGNFKWADIKPSQAVGLIGSAALPFAGGPLRAASSTTKVLPGVVKAAGVALDPLSALGAVSDTAKARIAGREAQIGLAKSNVAGETSKLEQAQAGLSKAQEAKAGLESQLGAMQPPTRPVAPERFAQTLIKPESEVAKGAERAAETYKQVKLTTTENLFKESSSNYAKLDAKYGDLPVAIDDVKGIANALSDNAEALRGTSAQRAVQGKTGAIGPTIHGQSIEGLGPDAVRFIEEKLSTGYGLTVRDLTQMRDRLSAANRSASDISAINANKQVISKIDDALGHLPQQAGKDFQQARVFHSYVHDVAGPESITTQIFHQSPENVVKNIFLPEGKTAPNIEAIRKAKEIFNRTLPEGWSTITDQALAEFGSRIKDAKNGTLDVQKYLREFNRFEGAFREALPSSQFQAMQDFRNITRQFNDESAMFRAAQAGLRGEIQQAGKGVTEARGAVSAQTKALKGAQAELHATTGQKPSAVKQFVSPYSMMALAQVGQAIQASFTGNIVGVGRQLAQGVVWYTLGNPDFLSKMLGSPKLSAALHVVASGQGPTPKLVNAGRAIYESMQDGTNGNNQVQ